jgi:hypothetical protein
VDRDLGEAELLSGLEAGVTADDYAVEIDYDRLAEAELAEGSRYRVDGSVVVAGYVRRGGSNRGNGRRSPCENS